MLKVHKWCATMLLSTKTPKEVRQEMILHVDANCFYASVEMVEHPELRDTCMAVCGDPAQRHGIVLTASYPAKRKGVKTGMANWQALQACPGLTIVHPHYDLYLKYSKLLQRIYKRYSDQVEPFGMDECWISLPYAERDATNIAEEIRQTVKDETGLTVSIGVSFTKSLAKLGSDMKKPDAITVLERSNFKEKCWDLPASDLLYVGPQTTKRLRKYGIETIGQLANAPEDFIALHFGKNGMMLQSFANGTDTSPVAPVGYMPPPKSLGHGATCTKDLEENYAVWLALTELAQDVGHRLISEHFKTKAVHLCIKDNGFGLTDWVVPIHYATQSPTIMAQVAYDCFLSNYRWEKPVRALTITAEKLQADVAPEQIDFFGEYEKFEKQRMLFHAIDQIRGRFGKDAIVNGCMCQSPTKLATDRCESVKMPGMMYRGVKSVG